MSAQKYTKEEIDKATAIMEIERAVRNVSLYAEALATPSVSINSLLHNV